MCMHSTSAITSCPAPPSSPSGFISVTLHSSAATASATRGGLMRDACFFVKPAFTNSSVPLGYSQLASDVWYTMCWVTMCMATSGTSIIFSRVCLVVLFRMRRAGEKMTMGGRLENILKKENGLRLTLPFASIVEASAMGLGAMRC